MNFYVFRCAIIFSVLQGIPFNRAQQVDPQLLVGYWGQNGAGPTHGPANYERPLSYFCKYSVYDIINIGFINVLFETRDKDQLPGMNFANHCGAPINQEHPFVFRCPRIEAGIRECQSRGKKVVISLGGATGDGTLGRPERARKLALNLWQLFLGGSGYGYDSLRPFGTAILDGVDLDIEAGHPGHYAEFVKELRRLMSTDKKKKYIISGAPQCPYPDAHLGPVHAGSALQGAGGLFDYLYVQFYNNYCWTGDRSFEPVLNKWLKFAQAQTPQKPKVLIGLPAHPKGSGQIRYYRKPEVLKTFYKTVRDKPGVGGIMLWDMSWDQNNQVSNRPYSEHAFVLLRRNGLPNPPKPNTPPRPVSFPTSLPPRPRPSPLHTLPPLVPGTVDCSVLPDGLYRHPTDQSKFIQCSHGNSHTFRCPDGLNFDWVKKQCDWPAEYTLQPQTPRSRPPQTTKILSTIIPSTRPTRRPPLTGQLNCRVLPDGDYPHPSDPTKFIKCSHSIEYTFSCPKGLVFNSLKRLCDWPAVSFTSSPSVEQPRTTQSVVTLSSTFTVPAEGFCKGILTGNHAHPKYCTKFIACSNGNAHVLSCPLGLKFNKSSKQCDWPRNVKC